MLNFLGHSSTAEQKQSHSTMINELCDALLTSQGQERGKYIGVSIKVKVKRSTVGTGLKLDLVGLMLGLSLSSELWIE